ncbi:MAG: chromosomal replication initiator protein DnaA [Saprospiraceae bacterium]|nr:chromosomal replication initiator protein DnaA [Saprospiraceae bacterium]
MVKDCHIIWANCLRIIRESVNPQSFKTWFEPIKPVGLDGKSLTIQVPNKFFYEWLEEHYVLLLKKAVKSQLGEDGNLEYQILLRNDELPKATANGHANASITIDEQEIKNPFVIPGIRKLKIDPQLNKKYTFDSYIEGDCNRLARSAGMAVAKKPGGTSFNPLVIYGDVGLGKTHLAHAIGNQIVQDFEQKSVLYVSSEKFTNQIIQAIKNHEIDDFVNFYHMIDVLIVDDIQFLANKGKTQEIFFHIFNQLRDNGKQIILTSDRPPKDLDGMQERLISRLKWGLTADLQAPDLETRMAILESKMMTEGQDIPNDVVEFICYNIQNNIRELEGVFISLLAQASLNRREIDIDLAREVIQKVVSQISKQITVENIKDLVAEYFELPVEKLHSKTRKRSVVIARQLSMFLAKKLTNKSLKAIGAKFGGRDHSTVIYSCNAVQDLMDTDILFRDTVQELEKRVSMSMAS